MKKIMTNKEIYDITQSLNKIITSESTKSLPIKISFIIQSNFKTLVNKFETIESARMDIGKKYGVLSEDNTAYNIPPEKMELVQVELDELMAIQQPVEIMMVSLSELNYCDLNLEQVGALLFMIHDDSDDNTGKPALREKKERFNND